MPVATRAGAEFSYESTNGAVCITGYAGAGGEVTIPSDINGQPVTSIGASAFSCCESLTGVTIPNTVQSIGYAAFASCCGLRNVSIGNGVRVIGETAFNSCSCLQSVTMGNQVRYIGKNAFTGCTSLSAVYFTGDAPTVNYPFDSDGETRPTLYYLPGTSGWSESLGECPTAPWQLPNPVILTAASGFGIQANRFGFRVSWAKNASVVIEASPSLENPNWVPVKTNALSGGYTDYSDPEWASHPVRFFRVGQL